MFAFKDGKRQPGFVCKKFVTNDLSQESFQFFKVGIRRKLDLFEIINCFLKIAFILMKFGDIKKQLYRIILNNFLKFIDHQVFSFLWTRFVQILCFFFWEEVK